MLAIWSLLTLPFLNPTWTAGSSWCTYYWSLAWKILSIYFASVWDECNCVVVWTFFDIALLWDWNESRPFPILWPLLSFPNLLKAMAPHFSTLTWKIPWAEEPGGLQSMGSRRVWHNWVTSLSLFTFMHWRRKWQPTRVFLPGESQGRQSLVGCHLWGCTESDTTEAT